MRDATGCNVAHHRMNVLMRMVRRFRRPKPVPYKGRAFRAAYTRGYDAYRDGVPRDRNYYDRPDRAKRGTASFIKAWLRGWDDAQEMYR